MSNHQNEKSPGELDGTGAIDLNEQRTQRVPPNYITLERQRDIQFDAFDRWAVRVPDQIFSEPEGAWIGAPVGDHEDGGFCRIKDGYLHVWNDRDVPRAREFIGGQIQLQAQPGQSSADRVEVAA